MSKDIEKYLTHKLFLKLDYPSFAEATIGHGLCNIFGHSLN